MALKLSDVLPRLIAFPIPPRYTGRVAVALCLTVTVMAVARVHTFPGVLIAAGIAVGLMVAFHAVRGAMRKAP